MRISFIAPIFAALTFLSACSSATFATSALGDAEPTSDASSAGDANVDAPTVMGTDATITDALASDLGTGTATGTVGHDATADAPIDVGDATATGCGGMTCGFNEVCVRTYTTGGACLACADPSSCPPGDVCNGSCCQPATPSYDYACRPRPLACALGLSCSSCGKTLCQTGCDCDGASMGTMTCHCAAP
jgi:hypothetical protein